MSDLIALLGRRDAPVDGVEDYCSFLSAALARQGKALKKVRVEWPNVGWVRALRELWHDGIRWRGTWVILQYTALGWSRRGFPFGALVAFLVLRRRGVRCAVVFHESSRQAGGSRWLDRLRGASQDWVVRALYRRSTKSIFTAPIDSVEWLAETEAKAAFIPVGANIPERPNLPDRTNTTSDPSGKPKVIAVFCMSAGQNRNIELSDAVSAARGAHADGVQIRLVFLGRGTMEMRERIAQAFEGSGIDVSVLGVVPAEEVADNLNRADAQLFVSGLVSQKRGAALAGVACGLPIIGYAGATSGTPIDTAGLVLVPYRDTAALTTALIRILKDSTFAAQLRQRSRDAQARFFSWDAIARGYLEALDGDSDPAVRGAAAGGLEPTCQVRRKLSVVMYAHDFLPTTGGVQTYMSHLARGLVRLRADNNGLGVDQVAVTFITQSPANGMDDSALPYQIVRRPGFFQLGRLIRNADVIHIAGPCMVPLFLGWLLRKPIVLEHHGYQAACPNGLLFFGPTRSQCPGHFLAGRYGKCLACNSADGGSLRLLALTFPRRWLARRASANVSVSNHVSTQVMLPRSRTIYHGIDPAASLGPAIPMNFADPLQIGYVGRLVAEKGVGILLEAVSLLDRDGVPFHLTIVGDGPERGRLVSLGDSLGLHSKVSFTGTLSGEALSDALRGISVVVMPTLMEETAGLGIIEHMMRGGIVVVSDIGGLSEIVGDAGWKYPAGDATALRRCLDAIRIDPENAERVGKKAQERARDHFAADRMTREHLSAYLQTTGR
jgi:glycosyltransferase involved in cell wall biosynthesis